MLMESCVSSGARSVADFARAAVLQRAQMLNAQSGTLSGDLTTLGESLGELDAMLILARKRIRDVLGPSGSDAEEAPGKNGDAERLVSKSEQG